MVPRMVKSDHLMLVKTTLVILVTLLPSLVHGLFEDQIGKWDWRHRYIGRVESVINFHQATSSSIVVSTNQNVISSLSVLNGSIHWRQLLEEKTSPLETINLITSSDIYGGITEAVADPVVVSVSGNGRYVRKWSSSTGLLIKEVSLPTTLVEGVHDGSHQLLFNVDLAGNTILVAKLTPLNAEILNFDLNTGSLKKSAITITVPTGDWFNDSGDCSFVSSKYLVCVDSKNSSIKVLPIESTSFTSYPLSLFGLSSQESSSMKLVTFDHQMKSPSPVFALDLGGKDGFVVLKIVSNELKLVKILAKVSKLSIVPTNLPEEQSKEPKYAVFALIGKPEELKKSEKNPGKDNSAPFKVAAFDLDDWTDLKQLNGQFVMDPPVDIEMFQILPTLKPFQDLKHYKILVVGVDERISLISSAGVIHWTREESLASIVSAQMVDLPLSEMDSSLEQAFGPSSNVLTQFTSRISWQVAQVQAIMMKWVEELNDLIGAPLPSRSSVTQAGLEYSSLDKNGVKGKTRDYFGLNKIIVTLTSTGKVFGLDSVSGRILWSLSEPEMKELNSGELSMQILRTSSHYPHPAHAVVVTKSGVVVSFNPITGVVSEKTNYHEPLKQTLALSHYDDTHQKALILLTDSDHVHVYPKTSWPLFAEHKNKYYMMVGYPNTGIVTGYNFDKVNSDGSSVTTIWTTTIPVHECSDCNPLTITFKKQSEQVHSLGRVLGDRNVLYKYLNPNVAVVVVEGSDTQFMADSLTKSAHLFDLHLIDAVSGRILYTTNHKRSRGPVHVIHSENSIIYSYFNEKARRTEISALDLYEGLSQSNGTAFSSLDLRTPVVEHSTFIFPTGLRTMVDTVSEQGITNKHILIAISSGGLLELPKAFLDPRRPITPTPEHREEGLIPYMPELPVLSEGLINYNKVVQLVKGIEVSPAGLESTCLVFVYGLDTFYTRVMPSKTFDILKDDFDHLLIVGVLILLICLAYITKWFSSRKILKAAWM